MVEFLEEVLATHRVLLSIIISTLIAAIIIRVYWKRVEFWWTCTWYSFPVIGKIAKLSKDITSRDGNWFSSETTLCSDFYRYYNFKGANPEHYDICKDYLKKIDETGRKPFPLIMWIVVFALVILEALGFAYVLAGFTIPGASESLQQYGAFGIALIISIILVGFTHWTGYEIYKNGILKKIRTYFQNDKIEERKSLIPNNDIDISETTFADKDEKIYIQLLNRVKDANANATSSWMISIITAIFVVVIAIGATYVRGQVLEKQLIEEKSMTQTNVYEQSLPTSLIQTQQSADTKAFDEAQDSDRKGGWATFIVLAVLFIFIQLLGILFGMKWGFAGKKSEEAFKYLDGFDNKQDYIEFYKRKKESISRIADQKLKLLQQRMNQRGTQISSSAEGMNLLITKDNRTFKEYVKIQSEGKKEQSPKESNNSSEKNNTNPATDITENKIDTTKNEIQVCRNPECNKPLKKDSKRCGFCGTTVNTEKKCPKCNLVDSDPEAKFCSNCDEIVELI
ncbi:zinc ribbon domain-containing protein [Aliarcobacter butzleri]|uniref:zinc ribbon domain-containing protein n=1 Tax=Aliarcobacter butzleri TaxID=28197 RepID=UPI0021B5C596|nr:zinc ribbon domain-containing protein [Aliarcobacter butzleri]MCT7592951.1 zinc ribbon domain-containing protein [Aliarcobacter butzleri]